MVDLTSLSLSLLGRLNSFEFHIWEWWWDEEERGRVFESKYFRPLARNADIAGAVQWQEEN